MTLPAMKTLRPIGYLACNIAGCKGGAGGRGGHDPNNPAYTHEISNGVAGWEPGKVASQ